MTMKIDLRTVLLSLLSLSLSPNERITQQQKNSIHSNSQFRQLELLWSGQREKLSILDIVFISQRSSTLLSRSTQTHTRADEQNPKAESSFFKFEQSACCTTVLCGRRVESGTNCKLACVFPSRSNLDSFGVELCFVCIQLSRPSHSSSFVLSLLGCPPTHNYPSETTCKMFKNTSLKRSHSMERIHIDI